MHPLSLIVYLLMIGTKHTQADIVHKKHGLSIALIVGGTIVTIVGAIGLLLTKMHWQHLVVAMKGLSGAAAARRLRDLSRLIGLLLIYAAVDRRSYVPENQTA